MDMQSLENINSPRGRELLDRYSDYRDEDLENLMFKVDKSERDIMRSVVTLIKLRHKAKDKFSLADKMFFTPDGQEQSTGEKISQYIAGRFGKGKKIVDLTCSIGGNLVYLAQENDLIAVDLNEVNISCAQLNAHIYGVDDKIKFIKGDAFDNVIDGVDAFFADPDRSREGKTKTRSLFNSSPDIYKLLPMLMEVTQNIGIKISPAFNYSDLDQLPGDPEIEVISEDNVCKVAMLWFGEYKTCKRRATMFIKDEMLTYIDNPETKKAITISDLPLSYIYEPNKAIIKAHLIDELADEFSLSKLDPSIAYLTSDKLNESRKAFRAMKVITFGKYSLKNVQKLLKESESIKDINRANIISRGFPVKIEELYKKLKLKEGGDLFLIFTTINKSNRYYILTKLEK